MLIATAGHVDHGKTVLVKALTGVDTDRLPEEKERGLTIDLGFAYRELDGGEMLGFVDVPGHERFVRNMLAGVAAIDLALLVIAADDGPMPQTVEHLAILDLLGIPRGAVALTKIDKVPPERIDEVSEAIRGLLASTRLAGAPVFPVSGLTGAGVAALSAHLDAVAAEMSSRATDANFRLAIDRSFTVPGAGLVVTGAVFSGAAKVGDRLILSPAGIAVRIRAIHASSRASETGVAGQRCAFNIAGTGLEKSEVHRGDWLVADGAPEPTRRIDARLRVLASEAKAFAHWTPVHVHLGAASLTGRVAVLEGRSIGPGHEAVVQVLLDQPAVTVHGDRFILRDQSAQRTVAGGTVIDPFGPARGRARPERIAFLRAMEAPDPGAALVRLLEQEENGFDLDRFAQAWNLVPADAQGLCAAAGLVEIRTRRARLGVGAERWKALRRRQLDGLKAWHEAHPDRAGPDATELRRTLGRTVTRDVANAVQENLIRENAIVREGSSLRLPSHRAALSSRDAALWRAIGDHISSDALKPPVVSELAERLKMQREPLLAFLGKSAARGQLVKVADNRFFHPEAVSRLARMAESLAAESPDGAFDAKAYRDRSGIGRNLAIQVLEYFDNAGLTRRIGDTRKVIRESEELFGRSQD